MTETQIGLLPVILLVPVSTVFFNDFGHYFYIFTTRWWNLLLALTEPLDSMEPWLKTTGTKTGISSGTHTHL